MNLKGFLFVGWIFIFYTVSAIANLRLDDGDYAVINLSTNPVDLTYNYIISDKRKLIAAGAAPYQKSGVDDLSLFPYNLPDFFEIPYRDSCGKEHVEKLDTTWIKLKRAKRGSIYFIYTPENKFILKLYLYANEDDYGTRLQGKLLPDEGEPAFKSYKELVCAANDGNAREIRELLTNGVPFVWTNEPVSLTPLGWSVRWNRVDAFNVLIEHMPKDFYPYEYYWCIRLAAQDGHLEILKRLLESPLADNVPTLQLQDIFYHACSQSNPNSIEAVKMLLDHYKVGIDYQTTDFGHTLLFVAIDSKDIKLIKWLLDRGADPNAKLENGETPLQYARNEIIKKVLADAGAK